MQDPQEQLAWLLAGEDHPGVRDAVEYQEAQARLRDQPPFAQSFAEARDFNLRHPRLVGMDRLPGDARLRMAKVLEDEARGAGKAPRKIQGPWSVRRQFAWAAVLVLLLGGMSLLSSTFIEQRHTARQPALTADLPGFHAYASSMAASRFTLDHRDPNPIQLVQWLNERGSGSVTIPASLREQTGLGCKSLKWEHGNVSLICLKINGETVHLFVTDMPAVRKHCPPKPERLMLQGREAVQWADTEGAYLLITHDPGVALPEIML